MLSIASRKELVKEIKNTKDPIRKTILINFLKMNDVGISPTSERDVKKDNNKKNQRHMDNNKDNNKKNQRHMNNNKDNNNNNIESNNDNNDNDNDNDNDNSDNHDDDINELITIIKNQEKSLEKIERLKAYNSLTNSDMKNKNEKTVWGTAKISDPKYAEHVKHDTMNNKLMDRLNSEIDFRMNQDDEIEIEKPYGSENDVSDYDDYNDNCEKYENDRKNNRDGQKNISKKKLINNSKTI
jgi:hypothetical protein